MWFSPTENKLLLKLNKLNGVFIQNTGDDVNKERRLRNLRFIFNAGHTIPYHSWYSQVFAVPDFGFMPKESDVQRVCGPKAIPGQTGTDAH